MFPESPQRHGHQRSPNRTAEPLAKSVCGEVGGLDPARVLGSRDRAGREASAKDSEKLFLLLSGFQNSPIFSQGKDAPATRVVQGPEAGEIVEIPQLGGLHHRYERRAA
jgi:hypothetical protein